MSRRVFVICFTTLCFAFVPVLFWLGIYSSIVPTAVIFLSIFSHRVKFITLWEVAHVVVYLSVFTSFAFATFRIVGIIPKAGVRQFLLALLMLLPAGSSFARVLTYSSLRGGGGTYTFWTAVERYFEKRR